MIVEHRKTGKQYTITVEAWAKIKAKGTSDTYKIIEAPEVPKEVKNVRNAKAEKPEFDISNELTRIDDRLPSEDAGEI